MIVSRFQALLIVLLLAAGSSELMAQNGVTAIDDTIRLYRSDEIAADSQATYDPAELATRLRYPEDALMNGIEGEAIVETIVDTDGAVIEVTVTRTDSPLFVEASMDAVQDIRFTPARRDGRPVRTIVTIPVRFRIVAE